ncbi:MAG: phosphatidylglycerophosphatase A [Desulfobacterales bacterium]|jgi:phosphatidylglycerophosphatase A
MPEIERLVKFLATWGGVGNISRAPGTLGSLAALPLCYLLSLLQGAAAWSVVAIFSVLTVGICHLAEKIFARKDPGCIVIDEVAGQMAALAALPFTGWTVPAGFVLFRILDIAKPPPIGWLDRRLPGGLGITADDLAAGLMANLILRLGLFVVC